MPGADTFSCPLPALPEACEAPQCEYSPPAPPLLPPALHVQVMVSVTTVLLYVVLALLAGATFLFAMRARRHPNGAKGVKDELQKEATAWLRRTIVPLRTYAVDARARLTAWAAATYDGLRSGCSFAQLQTMVIAGLSGLWAWMTSKAEAAWVVVEHEAPILWERVCVWSEGVWERLVMALSSLQEAATTHEEAATTALLNENAPRSNVEAARTIKSSSATAGATELQVLEHVVVSPAAAARRYAEQMPPPSRLPPPQQAAPSPPPAPAPIISSSSEEDDSDEAPTDDEVDPALPPTRASAVPPKSPLTDDDDGLPPSESSSELDSSEEEVDRAVAAAMLKK